MDKVKQKSKVCVIDGGVMTMKAIFSYGSVKKKILDGILPESTFLPPVSYTFFLMCISALKKIGLNEGDKVILACDKTNSFVKFFYPEYKAQRKGMRDDATHIDFPYHFSVLDKFIDQMDAYSDWNIMWLPSLWNGADLLFTEAGEKFIKSIINDLNSFALSELSSVSPGIILSATSPLSIFFARVSYPFLIYLYKPELPLYF